MNTDAHEVLEILDECKENCGGPSKSKRSRKIIITIRLITALDKSNLRDRDAIHIMSAFLKALSLNILDFVPSRSFVKRARKILR